MLTVIVMKMTWFDLVEKDEGEDLSNVDVDNGEMVIIRRTTF